jgi:hypothetical protein
MTSTYQSDDRDVPSGDSSSTGSGGRLACVCSVRLPKGPFHGEVWAWP